MRHACPGDVAGRRPTSEVTPRGDGASMAVMRSNDVDRRVHGDLERAMSQARAS